MLFLAFHDTPRILQLLGVILNTLLHPSIKLRFSLEVLMDQFLQSLPNMKMMNGHFMEISKKAEFIMDQ